MNDEEIAVSPMPQHLARAGLCFDPAGPGLAGFPETELPEDTLFILDDRVPWAGHDLEQVCRELACFLQGRKTAGLLLDFERPAQDETRQLASALCQCAEALGCPVGLPENYGSFDGAHIFLAAPPCGNPPEEQRQTGCWMEALPTGCRIMLGSEEPTAEPEAPSPDTNDFTCQALGCHYRTARIDDRIALHFYDMPDTMPERMERMGCALAIGLYRQWRCL